MKRILISAILFSTSAFAADITNLVCTSNDDGSSAWVKGSYTSAAEPACQFESTLSLFDTKSVTCTTPKTATTPATSKNLLMGFTEEQGPVYLVQVLQKGEKEEADNVITSTPCATLGKLVRKVTKTDIQDKSDK